MLLLTALTDYSSQIILLTEQQKKTVHNQDWSIKKTNRSLLTEEQVKWSVFILSVVTLTKQKLALATTLAIVQCVKPTNLPAAM